MYHAVSSMYHAVSSMYHAVFRLEHGSVPVRVLLSNFVKFFLAVTCTTCTPKFGVEIELAKIGRQGFHNFRNEAKFSDR